jgi:hypothetical protein
VNAATLKFKEKLDFKAATPKRVATISVDIVKLTSPLYSSALLLLQFYLFIGKKYTLLFKTNEYKLNFIILSIFAKRLPADTSTVYNLEQAAL